MKIATLGPNGTFSHQACLEYDENAEIIFKPTIWDVFNSVKNNEVDKGIVPIENSISGNVGLSMDALMEFDLKICGEILISIKHNLVGYGKLNEIKYIYAHPHSFSQCQNFIRSKLGEVRHIPTGSNAISAQEISEKAEDKEYSAIVPFIAIKNYHLKSLARNIQDNRLNVTKFIVLNEKSLERTGKDRTSLVIYPHIDRPGLLYTMIGEFAKRDINLTEIESRPSKKKLGDYMFFIDLEGHEDDEDVKEALKEIEKNFIVKILGSYPRKY